MTFWEENEPWAVAGSMAMMDDFAVLLDERPEGTA
jgi:hypothetical protein